MDKSICIAINFLYKELYCAVENYFYIIVIKISYTLEIDAIKYN